MQLHAAPPRGSFSAELSGNPALRDTLRIARKLGCQISNFRGGDESYLTIPGVQRRMVYKGGRKDTPRAMLVLLRRLAATTDAGINGTEVPEPDAETRHYLNPEEREAKTAAAKERAAEAAHAASHNEPELITLPEPEKPVGGPSLPPQFVSREEVVLRCNSDAVYKPKPEEPAMHGPICLADIVRTKIKNSGKTAEEAMADAGIDPSNLYNLYRGTKVSPRTAGRWAAFLGMTEAAVLNFAEVPNPHANPNYGAETKTEPAPLPEKPVLVTITAAPPAPLPRAEAATKAGDIVALMQLAQTILADDLACDVHALDERKRAIIKAIIPHL